jgi:uncharacterized membrane protein YedE/YeeE
MENLPITTVVGWAAFAIGLVFGGVAQGTDFCTMGSLSDIVFMGDWRRFRTWMLAIAVAMVGSQAMVSAGMINLDHSIYTTPQFGWGGAIVGGLMFGFGMTHGSGCGFKTLTRAGSGNLKSMVVALVLGLFAYMTLRGLFAIPRTTLSSVSTLNTNSFGAHSEGIDVILSALTGIARPTMRWIATGLIAGALAIFALKDAAFRSRPRYILAAIVLGLAVPAGWYATGVIGYDDFNPTALASFTFVAPTANAMQYLMTYTGTTIDFGVASVGGVIVGAFLVSLFTKRFHIEAFSDTSDMIRHMVGGAFMGVGGVLALGCTIGQGLTGVSTLAVGSFLALISIIAGGIFGLKVLEEGSVSGGLKALFARG